MFFKNIFRGKERVAVSFGGEQAEMDGLLSSRAIHLLDHLTFGPGPYLPGQGFGQRPSLRRILGADFRDHRAYTPGDDIRFIDWRASARQEHIYVRQGELPKQSRVSLLLDCSASMDWGTPSKQQACLQISAALAYLALARGDRLTIQPIAMDNAYPLGPVSGKGQTPTVLAYLRQLSFTGSVRLAEPLAVFQRRNPHGGLVFLLSDFLDSGDFFPSLEGYPAPTWEVLLLQVLHPDELEPRWSGSVELMDVESGKAANYDLDEKTLQAYRDARRVETAIFEKRADAQNAYFTRILADWPLETGG